MRGCTSLLLCILILSATAAADDEPQRPPSPFEIADAVQTAVKAEDNAALKRMALLEAPDPWIVIDVLCSRQAYDDALAYAQAAPRPGTKTLAAYVAKRKESPPETKARQVHEKVRAAFGAGDPKAAAEHIAEITPPLDTVLRIHLTHTRAHLLLEEGRLDEGKAALQSATDAARSIGWLGRALDGYLEIGYVLYQASDWEPAVPVLEKALAIARELGDVRRVAGILQNTGTVQSHLGSYPEALALHEEALAIHRKHGNEAGVAAALNDIGMTQEELGRYALALASYEKSLAMRRKHDDTAGIAQVLNGLGSVARRLGQHEEALGHFEQALQIYRDLNDADGVSDLLGNVGVMQRFLGRHDEALESHKEVLRLKRAAGDIPGTISALANLAEAFSALGRFQAAIETHEEGLDLARSLGRKESIAYCLSCIGSLHLRQESYKASRLPLVTALEVLGDLPAPELRAEIRWSLGILELSEKRNELAMQHACRGIELARDLGTGLAEGEGSGARDVYAGLFDVGYLAALRAGEVEELVWFLESGRASSLLEALGSRSALEAVVVPPKLRWELAAARQAERQALETYKSVLRGSNRRARRAALKAWRTARDKAAAVSRRAERDVKTAAAVTLREPDDLELIRRRLLSVTDAIVYYALTSDEAFALIVQKDATRVVPLAASKKIEAAVDVLIRGDRHVDPDKAPALRALLVDPLELPPAITRLHLCPMGRLSYVPFTLLFPERELTYLPSGTTLGILMGWGTMRGRRVLGLGDPDYDAEPDPTAQKLRAGSMARLARLPATRQEVEAVAQVKLLDKAASETRLAGMLGSQERWRAVHFACHGLVDAERPMLSALALTADEKSDGFLTALEIVQLRMPADLVVMSACETAKGKIYATEGVVGLTHAFLFAGAPRVICSLWKVDDEATRALMVKFYELWNPRAKPGDPERPKGVPWSKHPGLRVAEALRKAQAYVRSHEKWKHPYYWAAWVLWGLSY